jgi:protein SCO1/2
LTGPDPEESNPEGSNGEDRASKFAQVTPPIPRKAIVIGAVVFAVLGLGGVVFDHFFGGPVGTPTAITAGTDPPGLVTTLAPAQKPTGGPGGGQLPASTSALLGLTRLSPAEAPVFTLDSTRGHVIALQSLRGKVVVLSFFDSTCNDICPVVATELRLAVADLGDEASRVAIVGVNTDPVATYAGSASAAESAAGLGDVKQWYFLTGTLPKLDPVWKAYGVSIEVQKSTQIVSHNNVLYFIDPKGRLRLRATPFADENSAGMFSLPLSTETRFASGIASSVKSLLPEPS